MRILRFDSGETFNNPNSRWGNPSHVLEFGDPGYVDPNPSPATRKPKTYHTMSNNEIPDAERSLLARGEDCADGCAVLQDTLPLKLVREADLRLILTSLKGSPAATPPVLGLIYQCKQAEQALAAANNERKNKDTECKAFLTSSRTSLLPILGRDPSPEWELAGYANAPAYSNAVPGTQEGRLQCLSALAVYLTQHPTYEVPAGGPRPEVTATLALALHNQLSTCRTAANSASNAQNDALTAKRAALQSLRRTLIALVDELQLRLPDDDPRWEVLGLNIPANPRPPEPASDLTLTSAGLGRILAEWEPGTRSDDDRILIQIVGVDADYREYGKSGGDGEELIKNLPPGATVKVKIIALNGSLEASSGPEAQFVVV